MLRGMRKSRSGSLVLLAMLALAWVIPTAMVLAQSDLDAAKTATEAPAAPAAAPAADPAAAPAAAPAAGAPAAPAKPQQSMLGFFYAALGPRYVVIFLALSFVFVAITVMCFLSIRRDVLMPASLIEGFEAHLNEKRYQEAYELAKTDESYLGKVLTAGLGKLSAGYDQAIEAMQEVMDDETMKLEHRISYVAMIGTLAPMFGLLGTVDGMVSAFDTIANSTSQPKPSELALGIQMALVTTLIGLWLAIPAIFLFGLFKNWVARFILEIGMISEGLMGRFGAKK
jgi:biopolymer transport protein ExbB